MYKNDIVIVGGGLGGLLCAAFLAKNRLKPLIIEKSNEIGGRFRNLYYRDYTLSTGALHIIPHGDSGPFAKLIKKLNLNVKIINSKPRFGVLQIKNKYFPIEKVYDVIKSCRNFSEKLELIKLISKMIFSMTHKEDSFKEWFYKNSNNDYLYQIFDTISRFSTGMNGEQIEASGFHSVVKHVILYGGSGIIEGGCGSIISELERCILTNNGKIIKNCAVEKIIVENGLEKVIVDNEKIKEIKCKYLISNLGPHITNKLLEGSEIIKEDLKKWKPTYGIKVNVASKKQIFKHTGIVWTVSTNNVSGIIEVTNADPKLAPKNRHLLIAFHTLNKPKNVKVQIERTKKELKNLIVNFDENCKFLISQTYLGEFPVNWAPHHSGIEPKIHIKNLFFIGDSVNTPYMMTERVAKSVEVVLKELKVI